MRRGLIERVLHALFPEFESRIVFFSVDESHRGLEAGVEMLIDLRERGDLRPVVIHGFHDFARLRQGPNGPVLDAPGVFYLKLPASLSAVGSVLKTAAAVQVPDAGGLDGKYRRHWNIGKIRAFKHACDNAWMSLKTNANRGRKALAGSPGKTPPAVRTLKRSRAGNLVEEYRRLKTIAEQLEIKNADLAGALLSRASRILRDMKRGGAPAEEIFDMAMDCSEKIRAVSEILNVARELRANE